MCGMPHFITLVAWQFYDIETKNGLKIPKNFSTFVLISKHCQLNPLFFITLNVAKQTSVSAAILLA